MKADRAAINSAERFNEFKQELIDAISAMEYSDDPHIILITSKGHDQETAKKMACACPGFIAEAGKQLIESATQHVMESIFGAEAVEIRTPDAMKMLGKGGEA